MTKEVPEGTMKTNIPSDSRRMHQEDKSHEKQFTQNDSRTGRGADGARGGFFGDGGFRGLGRDADLPGMGGRFREPDGFLRRADRNAGRRILGICSRRGNEPADAADSPSGACLSLYPGGRGLAGRNPGCGHHAGRPVPFHHAAGSGNGRPGGAPSLYLHPDGSA